MRDRTRAVGAAFGRAVATYDGAAALQHQVAAGLARRIAAQRWPATPSLLEIGCGTGRLLPLLAEPWGRALTVLTDLAPAMAASARRRNPGAVAVAMDAERPALRPGRGFDLICSSLAAQWFVEPAATLAALAGLLAPGGRLMLATLAAGSLAEWHEDAAGPAYPTLETWLAMLPAAGMRGGEIETIVARHRDALAFLRGLRRIGAHLPAVGAAPSSAGALRRRLRRFEAPGGFAVTWRIAYLSYQATGCPA